MAITYKVLGQLLPASTTHGSLYTVPISRQAVTSTLCVCNQGAASTAFRIAIRPSGASLDPKHYIAYDSILDANDTVFMTIGATLSSADIVDVYSHNGLVSFTLFGSESL